MRIEQLFIDRFGVLDHREFRDVSGQMNLFVGSGRDRTQLAQFVRWMLLGRTTGYPAVVGRASGSVTLTDRQRRATFIREHDGASYDRVTSTDGTLPGGVAGEAELARWLGQVTAAEFDILCMSGLEQGVRIQDLLAACASRGVDLTGTRLPSARLQDLRLRADETRRRWQQLPWRGQDLPGLLDRQRIYQQRLHGLELELQHRRDDVSLEFQDLGARIASAEQEIARRRESLRQLDEEIARRRAELDAVWQRAEDAQREFINERRRDLSDIDSHMARARDMLSEIQLRRDAVHDRLERSELCPDALGDRTEATLCLVESLARQLDAMGAVEDRDRVTRVAGYEREPIHRPRRVVTTEHLADLRTEVGRLCRTLQDQRELGRRQLLADEAGNLNQSAAVLQRWISDLTRQRDQLLDEIDEAEHHGVSLVEDERERRPTDADPHWDRYHVRDVRERSPSFRFRAVAHACDGITPRHPREDDQLQSLLRRRETEDRALIDAETTLRQWIERRRDLEDQRWRVRERELDLVRRDLHELDSLIRTAEERERLERELKQIEDEMARCHDEVQPSTTARHAGEVLIRLSDGELTAVQFMERHHVQVQSTRSGWMSLEQLSGPQRTEVYVSILMAVASAVRTRGVDLPLFLETSYLEWAPGVLHRFASEVEALARQGHQVFVLTADDAFARRLADHGARRYEVQPLRADAMPPVEVPPSIDSVRFRPQGIPREFNEYRHARHGGHTNGWHPIPTVPDSAPRPGRESIAGSEPEGLYTNVPRRAVLGSVGVVPPEVADRLIERGIRTVGEFLSSSPMEMEREVASWGVRAPQLQRWQSELGLCCALAEIRPGDARLLVAAGVVSTQQLAAAEESQLWKRIQQLTTYGGTRNDEGRDARLLRSRLADWLHAARRLYPEFRRLDPDRVPPDADMETDRLVARRRRRRRREIRSELRPTRHQRRAAATTDAPSAPRRRERSHASQFHLHVHDDIVSAPSIGPKTAERFRDAGVTTVAEFLAAEPVLLAEQLNNRRITATMIDAWQAQARMACRIPNLRGHDAQVLVACDITTAEDLAQFTPEELWDRIQPFLRTNECKRIIRNGKLPDEDEIAGWVRSAQQARSLQAA